MHKMTSRHFGVVDLITNIIRVHRKPTGHCYQSVATMQSPAILDIAALSRIALSIADIFA
jgi:hypothetical protein